MSRPARRAARALSDHAARGRDADEGAAAHRRMMRRFDCKHAGGLPYGKGGYQATSCCFAGCRVQRTFFLTEPSSTFSWTRHGQRRSVRFNATRSLHAGRICAHFSRVRHTLAVETASKSERSLDHLRPPRLLQDGDPREESSFRVGWRWIFFPRLRIGHADR